MRLNTLDNYHTYLDMVNVKTGIPKHLVQFDKIQSADWISEEDKLKYPYKK